MEIAPAGTRAYSLLLDKENENETTARMRSASTPDLVNHGGKILKNPAFASVYYGGYWNTSVGKRTRNYIDSFGRDIVKSEYTNLWKEYGSTEGRFAGSTTMAAVKSPNRFGPGAVDDAGIREIVKMAREKMQNAPADTVFTIFLPPHTILEAPDGSTSLDGLGGYHASYNDAHRKKVYYAAIVYSEKGNGIPFSKSARDNITITASHEWTEAATDPDVNNGRLAWYDDSLGEVSDIPLELGLPLDQLWGRVDGFAVQKQWSNQSGGVVLTDPAR